MEMIIALSPAEYPIRVQGLTFPFALFLAPCRFSIHWHGFSKKDNSWGLACDTAGTRVKPLQTGELRFLISWAEVLGSKTIYVCAYIYRCA